MTLSYMQEASLEFNILLKGYPTMVQAYSDLAPQSGVSIQQSGAGASTVGMR